MQNFYFLLGLVSLLFFRSPIIVLPCNPLIYSVMLVPNQTKLKFRQDLSNLWHVVAKVVPCICQIYHMLFLWQIQPTWSSNLFEALIMNADEVRLLFKYLFRWPRCRVEGSTRPAWPARVFSSLVGSSTSICFIPLFSGCWNVVIMVIISLGN